MTRESERNLAVFRATPGFTWDVAVTEGSADTTLIVNHTQALAAQESVIQRVEAAQQYLAALAIHHVQALDAVRQGLAPFFAGLDDDDPLSHIQRAFRGRLAKGKILYAKGVASPGAMERATRCRTAILERCPVPWLDELVR